jgi:hypothetical protein
VKIWKWGRFQIEPKTQKLYSLHSSIAEHQLLIKGGVCSNPAKHILSTLRLSPSQDENVVRLKLAGHLELVGHL